MYNYIFLWLGSIDSQHEVPEAPAEPAYEEISIATSPRAQEIEVESNEAYGQVS